MQQGAVVYRGDILGEQKTCGQVGRIAMLWKGREGAMGYLIPKLNE